ncbi:MAG: EI24 domain-containing protein [Bacteroidota bacterium]
MSLFKQVSTTFKSHGEALTFILKNGLWYYFLFPAIITVVFWIFGYMGIVELSNTLTNDLMYSFFHTNNDGQFYQLLFWILSFLIGITLKILLFFLFNILNKYLVLIFCSPVLAVLSTHTERLLTNTKTQLSLIQFLKDISRGILVVLRNFFMELGIVFISLILIWVPILNYIIPPIQWSFNWYFIGYSLLDYNFERRGWTISEGTQYCRNHKGIAISLGFIFSQLIKIPILGICIAPILGTVASTLLFIESEHKPITS